MVLVVQARCDFRVASLARAARCPRPRRRLGTNDVGATECGTAALGVALWPLRCGCGAMCRRIQRAVAFGGIPGEGCALPSPAAPLGDEQCLCPRAVALLRFALHCGRCAAVAVQCEFCKALPTSARALVVGWFDWSTWYVARAEESSMRDGHAAGSSRRRRDHASITYIACSAAESMRGQS